MVEPVFGVIQDWIVVCLGSGCIVVMCTGHVFVRNVCDGHSRGGLMRER